MRPPVRTGAPESPTLREVWVRLAPTLAELDRIAGEPEAHLAQPGAGAELAALQYGLHEATEHALAIDDELEQTLAEAREATAEVVELLAHGGVEAAAPLVWEWRGALFAVRIAWRRIAERAEPAAPEPVLPRRAAPALLASGLLALGLVLTLGGALAAEWPLWAAGVLAVVAGALSARELP